MSTMIETLKLSRSFGSIVAVDDLSFKVAKGEVLGFLGPNGAGKSTTMKMLTCFLTPSSGTARIGGHDVIEDPMQVRRMVGYLPESAPAYAEMTAGAFLKFVARIRGYRGAELNRVVDAVVEKCSLQSVLRQTFETLSKGFKRRTCLAQALLHDPPVLIMDEPTDGLDPNQKHEVRRLITEMAPEKCIILSTHILEEVETVCTRAIIITDGRLVADATPDALRRKSRFHGAVTIAVRGGDAGEIRAALESIPDVAEVEPAANGASGHAQFDVFPRKERKISAAVAELAREKGWDCDELHLHRGHLDEVFRMMTAKTSEVQLDEPRAAAADSKYD